MYYNKYLKYKNKYLSLKGGNDTEDINIDDYIYDPFNYIDDKESKPQIKENYYILAIGLFKYSQNIQKIGNDLHAYIPLVRINEEDKKNKLNKDFIEKLIKNLTEGDYNNFQKENVKININSFIDEDFYKYFNLNIDKKIVKLLNDNINFGEKLYNDECQLLIDFDLCNTELINDFDGENNVEYYFKNIVIIKNLFANYHYIKNNEMNQYDLTFAISKLGFIIRNKLEKLIKDNEIKKNLKFLMFEIIDRMNDKFNDEKIIQEKIEEIKKEIEEKIEKEEFSNFENFFEMIVCNLFANLLKIFSFINIIIHEKYDIKNIDINFIDNNIIKEGKDPIKYFIKSLKNNMRDKEYKTKFLNNYEEYINPEINKYIVPILDNIIKNVDLNEINNILCEILKNPFYYIIFNSDENLFKPDYEKNFIPESKSYSIKYISSVCIGHNYKK
jgi:hypothetical protein